MSLCGTPRSWETPALNLQGTGLFCGSTCLASFMSQLLGELYSCAVEEFCVLKGGPKNIPLISSGAQDQVRVGQMLCYSIKSQQSQRF